MSPPPSAHKLGLLALAQESQHMANGGEAIAPTGLALLQAGGHTISSREDPRTCTRGCLCPVPRALAFALTRRVALLLVAAVAKLRHKPLAPRPRREHELPQHWVVPVRHAARLPAPSWVVRVHTFEWLPPTMFMRERQRNNI